MNLPNNPMNAGMNSNQFDGLGGKRMPSPMINHSQQQQQQQQQQPPQQPLQSHLHQQMSQQNSNPNFLANKLRVMSPQLNQTSGKVGPNQNTVQQSLPASNNLGSMVNRSTADTMVSIGKMGMSSPVSALPTSSSMTMVSTQHSLGGFNA